MHYYCCFLFSDVRRLLLLLNQHFTCSLGTFRQNMNKSPPDYQMTVHNFRLSCTSHPAVP